MVGTTLGNYKILEKLGAGGQGTVYKATDTKLGRTVVIKVLPEELTAQEANLKRFEREARLASALDHPNICTIFDLNVIDGVHFIAMQYVEGRNVRQLRQWPASGSFGCAFHCVASVRRAGRGAFAGHYPSRHKGRERDG